MSAKSYATFYNQASSIWHDEHNKGKRMIMAKKGSEQYKAIKIIEAKIRSGEIQSKVVKRARKKKAVAAVAAVAATPDFIKPQPSNPRATAPKIFKGASKHVGVAVSPPKIDPSMVLPERKAAKFPTKAEILSSQDAAADKPDTAPIKEDLGDPYLAPTPKNGGFAAMRKKERERNRILFEKLSKR